MNRIGNLYEKKTAEQPNEIGYATTTTILLTFVIRFHFHQIRRQIIFRAQPNHCA